MVDVVELTVLLCCGGTIGIDGPAAFQEEGQELGNQIQILTVGHSPAQESEAEGQGEAVGSTQSQGKQDLRVTMLKKGTPAIVLRVTQTRAERETGGEIPTILSHADLQIVPQYYRMPNMQNNVMYHHLATNTLRSTYMIHSDSVSASLFSFRDIFGLDHVFTVCMTY